LKTTDDKSGAISTSKIVMRLRRGDNGLNEQGIKIRIQKYRHRLLQGEKSAKSF
jgi:hypothetical protein